MSQATVSRSGSDPGAAREGLGASSDLTPRIAPRLILEDVCKRFHQDDGSSVVALDGVSIEVDDAKFVALIGPSGCGKTTVLRVANGLITPDSGKVSLSGRPPRPGPEAGFVFQSFRLLPWATVRSNVEFALLPPPMSSAERRERSLHYLSLVGLSRSAESYPGQLSGGMRQRVALARALAVEPQILLMDEPFASLDAQTRELMQAELMSIWAQRRVTVLFVTHSVDEAILLADQVVLMGSGRALEVVEVGIGRPRLSSSVRSEKRFLDLRGYLWNRIRDLVLSDPASDFYGRDLSSA
jgi:NitT/TauT family transport system ATP-binding protein